MGGWERGKLQSHLRLWEFSLVTLGLPAPHLLHRCALLSRVRWHSAKSAVSFLRVNRRPLELRCSESSGAANLFATEAAVVILRDSCVNSVFSSTVNDNSATTCKPFGSGRHAFPAPLLPKLSAANPDQKVKKRVKRESLMLSSRELVLGGMKECYGTIVRKAIGWVRGVLTVHCPLGEHASTCLG
ncbi:unnamed protein product [Pleuronectes platessa]|uniref:Uncharacterized protein n=1 Tax=Pleuronectes platessa TaxID=8262 RepID=A0A9N7YPA3_PLEPL|nr:unnamed protein product [Pleuronectes platessa]